MRKSGQSCTVSKSWSRDIDAAHTDLKATWPFQDKKMRGRVKKRKLRKMSGHFKELRKEQAWRYYER